MLARRAAILLGLALPGGCGDDLSRDLPDSWTVGGPGVAIHITREPLAFSILDADGQPVLRSLGGGDGDGFAALGWTSGEVFIERFVSPGYWSFASALEPWRDAPEVVAAEESRGRLILTAVQGGETAIVSFETGDSSVRISARAEGGAAPRAWATAFASPEGEGFLGFGERFNRTDQRGEDVFSYVEEGGLGTGEGQPEGRDNPFPHGALMTYYPVPFFLSTAGYGFWLDTTHRSEFNLASQRPDAWRAWHVGPELAFEVYLPRPDDQRPWPYHIIDSFTAATGRPMLPPAWSFGPRRRISSGSTALDMPEIEAMRAEDLAITSVDDAVHFYPAAHHIGREEALADWIAQAAALGYRVNAYYNSFLDRDPDAAIADRASEGAALGHYLLGPDGEVPDIWLITGSSVPQLYLVDFTSPAATAWYQESFDWALSLGYSGWMYDFGEYVPPEVVAADGTTGEALHNQYPVLYARAAATALEAGPHAGDWLAFMRSGYTGSSAFVPMAWSGDPAASFEESDGLPSMVPAGVNLGISGAPHWGGDIGGFHCTADGAAAADEELLTRWIQQGSMSSSMQDQNACVGASGKANIWTAPAARAAWSTYARLHTRLFPYLYTLAHQASATGAPVMRHPFLEHPDDPSLRAVDDAYYLGPALYVAPVLHRGETTKSVRLPAGRYLDWRDQVAIDGGGIVDIPAPLDKLPLLLRAGHLVPLLDPAIDTLAEEDNPDVVGPADVSGQYDVVGFLTAEASAAEIALWDGDTFTAVLTGAVAPPADMAEAASEEELASCDACYRIDLLAGGLTRVRITTGAAAVTAGGLSLGADSPRRTRWDLYLMASSRSNRAIVNR